MAVNQIWRRRLTHGSNASVVTVVGMAIVVLLYIAAMQTRVRWDFTEEGRNTLSADMRAKLALLDADNVPVTITAFTAQRGQDDARLKDRYLRDTLREIGLQSTVVDWRMVDFDRERLTAERLSVTEYSHVVVQRGAARVDIRARDLFRRVGKGDQRRVLFSGEGAFAGAFSQLHTPKRRVVYSLVGHGERSVEDRGPSGLSDFADALNIERYDSEDLSLLSVDATMSVPSVPEDAAVVIVAGAEQPLANHEEDALLTFLGQGGGIMIAIDPGQPVPSLVGRLGLTVPSGAVMDTKVVYPFWDRPIPVLSRHPINQGLDDGGLKPVLAHVAPVGITGALPQGVDVEPVLVTSRRGWTERGGDLVQGAPQYDAGIDGEGPVTMAAAAQLRPGTEWVRSGRTPARVVVVGDSDFLGNGLLLEGPGNSTFALDAVHWLAGADLRVASVGARKQKARKLAISKQQLDSLRFVSMGVLPVLVGLLGFAVRWTRRGR